MIPQLNNFAGHNLLFDTERLRPRPFEQTDFDLALPFYRDLVFLNAMEGQPPDEPVTADYLRRVGKAMAMQGFLFAFLEVTSSRTISEACLQWMNLGRAKIANTRSAALWHSCGLIVSRKLNGAGRKT